MPTTQTRKTEKRNIAASVIYRSLLASILDRGYTKAYSYGAQYLKKLDTMAASITDWGNFEIHDMTCLRTEFTRRTNENEVSGPNMRGNHELTDVFAESRLHDVIQIVIGWTDSHLHEFTIGKKRYTEYPQERGDGLQNEIACLDGARACPPEDAGGIPGYFDSE